MKPTRGLSDALQSACRAAERRGAARLARKLRPVVVGIAQDAHTSGRLYAQAVHPKPSPAQEFDRITEIARDRFDRAIAAAAPRKLGRKRA